MSVRQDDPLVNASAVTRRGRKPQSNSRHMVLQPSVQAILCFACQLAPDDTWFATLPIGSPFPALTLGGQLFWVGIAIASGAAVALGGLLITAFRRRAGRRLDLVWFRGWAWLFTGIVLGGAGLVTLANSDTVPALLALGLAALSAARAWRLLRR
jgi:hypothetical protein